MRFTALLRTLADPIIGWYSLMLVNLGAVEYEGRDPYANTREGRAQALRIDITGMMSFQ